MTKQEIAADRKLQKKYGITLAEYNEILAKQGGVCKICGRPPGKNRLSTDHDHRFNKIKIKVYLEIDKTYWVADALPFVMPYGGFSNKKEAKIFIRNKLKRLSIRGILCWQCNSGLRKYSDNPERFEAAARYLREYNNKLETLKSGTS